MREGLLDQDGLTGHIQCQNLPLKLSLSIGGILSSLFLLNGMLYSKIIGLRFLVSLLYKKSGLIVYSYNYSPQVFRLITNHSVSVNWSRPNFILNQLQTN